jgi:formate hydrogenlyase subunit 3/multisubunit Na+/H+ antiporter MnhD subunit
MSPGCMNPEPLILLFPFIPLLLLAGSLAAGWITRRDWSGPAYGIAAALQLLVGAALILRFHGADEGLTVAVGTWRHSIVFAFDRMRVGFLFAYLVPLAASLGKTGRLASPHLRTTLLFYLAGCSGVIVAGDVFNFFVAFELMIMAAYVLVAARREYYAAVKYMLFGALSSTFFLLGIVVRYAGGASFSFDCIHAAAAGPAGNVAWTLLLFATAFGIKGAFFPAHSWAATCHSATVAPVSAFLGSFTIFSGVFGMYYLVILPARAAGFEPILTWLRAAAWATVLIPAGFVFLEPALKRVIAGSTVIAVGFTVLLMTGGHDEAAFRFIALHAVYKTVLFHLLDEVGVEGRCVSGRRMHAIAAGTAVWLAVGAFPALSGLLKSPAAGAGWAGRLAAGCSMALLTGAFLKFRWRMETRGAGTGLWLGAAAALALLGWEYPGAAAPAWPTAILECSLLVLLAATAPALFRRLEAWAGADRRWLFRNLNAELFAMLLLFASAAVTVFR